MRTIITIILFILFLPQVYAQSDLDKPARLGEYNNFDTSIMECVYEHATYDPIKKVLNALIGYWKSVKMEVNTAYIRHINAIR